MIARARAALLAVTLLVASYGVAGMIGGAIPANAGWQPPRDGVHVFVDSNGVHTAIITPQVAAGIDWRAVARATDLGDPRYAVYDHMAFGWGERAFYRETPRWADAKPLTILRAAIGSDRTLMHVDHLPRPTPGDTVREIVLTPVQYRRLARFIRASFADPRRAYPGYGPDDAFYDARGRYSAIATCNAWVGDALRQAGVRIGRWTPFPVTVLGWF